MESRKLYLAIASVLLLVFSLSLAAFAADRGIISGSSVPGEVLVGFDSSATLSQMNAIIASIGGTAVKKISLPKVKIWRVKLSDLSSAATDAAVGSLKKVKQANPSGKLLFAEPNIIRKALGLRSGGDVSIESQSGDAELYNQWGYYDIAANWLPDSATTAPMVAVIDTGVDYTHPDLVGKVVKGPDFVNADTNPMDDNKHGTHVAGIIAANANNGYGIAGVSWRSKILAIKVLDSQGYGSSYDIALGILAAANNASVKVISMSLGGDYSTTEDTVVDYAVNVKGKLLVAAAGNDGVNTPSYPAGLAVMSGYVSHISYQNKVLAVAAHDQNDCKASFSNYGSWVSITAPGVNILSTVPMSKGGSGFAYLSGTSMATPFVSGAAAVAWAKFPTYKNDQIGALLTSNTAGPALTRDDSCWPNDGSTFERLNLVHVIDAPAFEGCSNGTIVGYAMDAESGEPLSGAKVSAKQGLKISGTDYVPFFGEVNDLSGGLIDSGYGLFSVAVKPGGQNNSLSIAKTGYTAPVLKSISAASCFFTPATANGIIPVPPNKPGYWLVITWAYGSTDTPDYPSYTSAVASYDSYLNVPNYGSVGYGDNGTLNASPFAKWLWDNDNESSAIDLRSTSEAIRILKFVPGTYTYEVDDWLNGASSTAWGTSKITAYVYKWNPATLKPVLVQTITPPDAAAGEYWHVVSISGNTVTVNNTVDDSY